MATTSSVHMLAPGGVGDTGFYVHYDGDDVGTHLRVLIDRDGYEAVYAVFSSQRSRYWRQLTPDMTDELPEYITRFPENLPRCQPIAGYGVLFMDHEAITASGRYAGGAPEERNRNYHIVRSGRVYQSYS